MAEPVKSERREESAEEREAREAREAVEYRKRLQAGAEQAARHVAFSIGRNCSAVMEDAPNGAPRASLRVDGVALMIDMMDDRTVSTADGPKPVRRPVVKRIGELLRLARKAIET